MKYKFSYQDPEQVAHVRYYTALNCSTATEMFKASITHSIKESVVLTSVCRLEDSRWEPVDLSTVDFKVKKS